MRNLSSLALSGCLCIGNASAQDSVRQAQDAVVDSVIKGLEWSTVPPHPTQIERYYMLLDGQLFKVKPNLSLTHAYRYAVNVIYFLDGKNKFPALVSLKDTVANRFATEKLETEKDDLETKAGELMKRLERKK